MAHPWLGAGLGSYPLSITFFATPADWELISSCQTAPLNGFWLILAERGVIGAFSLAVPLVLLLVTYGLRMVEGARSGVPHPLVLLGPVLLIVAMLEMLGDTSILAAGALLPLASALAISSQGFAKEGSHGR